MIYGAMLRFLSEQPYKILVDSYLETKFAALYVNILQLDMFKVWKRPFGLLLHDLFWQVSHQSVSNGGSIPDEESKQLQYAYLRFMGKVLRCLYEEIFEPGETEEDEDDEEASEREKDWKLIFEIKNGLKKEKDANGNEVLPQVLDLISQMF